MTVLSHVDSTNQYLLNRAYKLQSGDACLAEYQKAGRGRRRRHWVSPFGTNLYLSIFWRLAQGPSAAVGLSLVIAVVIAEVLQRLGAHNIRVKWPNDLYLNDRKLAGILVELIGKTGDAAHLVIGVGVNLTMCATHAQAISQRWINLQETGISVDRNALAAILINTLRQSMQRFEKDGLTPLISNWNLLDNCINRPVKLIIGEEQIFGIAKGVNQNGALLLDQQGIITPFMDGEISLRNTE